MYKYFLLILGTMLIILAPLFCNANPSAALGSSANPIRVGLGVGMPFAGFKDNKAIGLVPKIWEKIANANHWHYRYYPLGENVKSNIVALKKGQFDIVMGPVSVTHDRLLLVNYSRPFYLNQIGIATFHTRLSIGKVFLNLTEHFFGPITLIFIAIFILMIHLFWLIERNNENSEIKRSYFSGITQSTWLIFIYLISYNYFIEPKTKAARAFAAILFPLAFIFVVFITSSITAFMTSDLLKNSNAVTKRSDLYYKHLAYVEGKNTRDFIKAVHAIPIPEKNLNNALTDLNNNQNKVTGVVEDYMVLKTRINQLRLDNIELSPLILSNDEFAFALPYGSPLTQPINNSLVKLQDNGTILSLCKDLLPENYLNCSF
jgi:polar amino acid transport system substrate-binding protein